MINPLGDRVAVETLEATEEVRASGIVLPGAATEPPTRGTVVAVGAGRYENGTLIPMPVKVGDVVAYPRYSGVELEHEGTTYLILREGDLLAVV